MRNSHIAFFAFPSSVNTNPTLPIISTLVRRGHRVTCPTSDKFAMRISASGAEVLSCQRIDTSSKTWVLDHAAFVIEELSLFYERNKPDIIVYDLASLAGPVLSNRFGTPAVMLSVYFPFDETKINKRPSYRGAADRITSVVNKFFEHYGVPESNLFRHLEELNVYLFPAEFDPSRIGDVRCLYAGRCVGEQLSFGSWEKKCHDGRPVALVTTSTTHVQGAGYFRMCTDALVDLGWHVILSIADDTDLAALSPLPANFEIVQRTSHTRILPFANLLIFNGGIITSSEAVYHGVPMIIASCGVEELEDLADNLVRLGLGIHLRKKEMSSESLRNCARKVLEDSAILENVKQLQRSVRRQAGAEEVANRIEECIESRKR